MSSGVLTLQLSLADRIEFRCPYYTGNELISQEYYKIYRVSVSLSPAADMGCVQCNILVLCNLYGLHSALINISLANKYCY